MDVYPRMGEGTRGREGGRKAKVEERIVLYKREGRERERSGREDRRS